MITAAFNHGLAYCCTSSKRISADRGKKLVGRRSDHSRTIMSEPADTSGIIDQIMINKKQISDWIYLVSLCVSSP